MEVKQRRKKPSPKQVMILKAYRVTTNREDEYHQKPAVSTCCTSIYLMQSEEDYESPDHWH